MADLIEKEMKPCPFCGTMVVFVSTKSKSSTSHRFLCRSEECMMADFEIEYEDKTAVVDWWNDRTEVS